MRFWPEFLQKNIMLVAKTLIHYKYKKTLQSVSNHIDNLL